MLRKGDLTQGGITGTLLHFYPTHDGRVFFAAMLQHCRYAHCRPMHWCRGVGGGRFGIHTDGFPYIRFAGTGDGQWHCVLLHYGAGNHVALRRSIFSSFALIGIVTLILNVVVFIWLDPILRLLQVPQDIYGMMRSYLWIIFCGIVFTLLSITSTHLCCVQ